jgi:hypothetical protein
MLATGRQLSRKPKSKLPAGWDVYSRANQKPIKRRVRTWWKYVPWALLIGGLAGIAFYPWPI